MERIIRRVAAGASPARIRRLNDYGLPLLHLLRMAALSVGLLVSLVLIFGSLILVAFAWRLV